MLEEKLENARRRSRSRSKLIIIGSSAVVALCGLVMIALSFVDFSEPIDTYVAPVKRAIPVTTDQDSQRDEFKEMLRQYENELAPRLRVFNIEQWNGDAYAEINEVRKKAISSFSEGDYIEALAGIQLLVKKTKEILGEAENIFNSSLEKAASFLAEDLYEEARLQVNKALMLVPQSPEGLELQEEIEKLPALLLLLSEAGVARSENDFQKEHDLLQQVVVKSPGRKVAVERLNVLAALLQQQKFEAYISKAFSALENRNPKEARDHYQKAIKVDPGREELSLFTERLLDLEKSLKVESAIRKANQAVRIDDWQQAQIYFDSAIKEAPHNTIAVEGKKRADLVIRLQ
ncbi:MAG: hypothetical protein ACN4GW_07165, partial [Desulforhopalus sp.]